MKVVAALLLLVLSLEMLQRAEAATEATAELNGVHLISVIVSPDGPASDDEIEIQIVLDNRVVLHGEAFPDLTTEFDMAAYLSAGQMMEAKAPSDFTGSITLTYAYFAELASTYLTYFSQPRGIYASSPYIGFTRQLSTSLTLEKFSTYRIWTFEVPAFTGLYWVTVLINCKSSGVSWGSLQPANELFSVYCTRGWTSTASGAFNLTSEANFFVKYEDGGGGLEAGNMISMAFLDANRNIPEHGHLAYTARVGFSGRRTNDKRVPFGKNVKTDFGSMYNQVTRIFTVRLKGDYLVSVYGDPSTRHDTLLVNLYRGSDELLFTFTAKRGHSCGQTTVLSFEQGDELFFKLGGDKALRYDTFVSIALFSKS